MFSILWHHPACSPFHPDRHRERGKCVEFGGMTSNGTKTLSHVRSSASPCRVRSSSPRIATGKRCAPDRKPARHVDFFFELRLTQLVAARLHVNFHRIGQFRLPGFINFDHDLLPISNAGPRCQRSRRSIYLVWRTASFPKITTDQDSGSILYFRFRSDGDWMLNAFAEKAWPSM